MEERWRGRQGGPGAERQLGLTCPSARMNSSSCMTRKQRRSLHLPHINCKDEELVLGIKSPRLSSHCPGLTHTIFTSCMFPGVPDSPSLPPWGSRLPNFSSYYLEVLAVNATNSPRTVQNGRVGKSRASTPPKPRAQGQAVKD